MKPFQKVLAVVLAALMMFSAASCGMMSLTKEWSYKYNDKVLNKKYDIGVYIYALFQAYTEAESLAAENENYKEGKDFTKLEITDEDGDTAVANVWIKDRAEEIAGQLIAVDYLVAEHEATWDQATMSATRTSYRELWDKGYQGYYAPLKDTLEKYGVSFDSYYLYISSSIKMESLFHKIYGEGGVEEVSDKELTKFFKDEYIAYSYVPVNLYETTTDSSGASTTKTFGKNKKAELLADMEAVASQVNSGAVANNDALKTVRKDNKVSTEAVIKENVELYETTKSNNSELAKAIKKLGNNTADVITIGEASDTPVAYFVIKHNIEDYVKKHINKDENRSAVLENCKSEDFETLVDDKTEAILKSGSLKKNTAQFKRYKPSMFKD